MELYSHRECSRAEGCQSRLPRQRIRTADRLHPTGANDTMTVIEDPIVAETRVIRRELSDRFGNDINALCDFLAERELNHKHLLVNHPPKPPEAISVAERSRK
jgi:hypothetical protein